MGRVAIASRKEERAAGMKSKAEAGTLQQWSSTLYKKYSLEGGGKIKKKIFIFYIQLKIPFLVSALDFFVWVTGRTVTAEVPNHSGTFLLQGGCELWKKKTNMWKKASIYRLTSLHSSTSQQQVQQETGTVYIISGRPMSPLNARPFSSNWETKN